MRKVLLAACLGSAAAFTAGAALANDELIKMSQNPKDWVMPTGDYEVILTILAWQFLVARL